MTAIDFFQELGIDTKNYAQGSHYVQCPKCHDERKKKGAKELLINLDTGYCECFHCGWKEHILKSLDQNEKVDYTPKPAPVQKFISPEPLFNWIVPDAIIEPKPSKPMIGKYSITWYYRNIDDKLTGAKKMEYDFHENGFNRADKPPLHLYTRDSGYYPCLFYERDLHLYPYAKVILLESEKTAAVLRRKFRDTLKEFIFLATAGSNGLTDEKAKVLSGRTIMICFDCDKGGRDGAHSAHTKLAGIASSVIIDINPENDDGQDLADIETDISYIRSLEGVSKYPPDLINKIRELNRSGVFWSKDRANDLGQTFMIEHAKVYEIGRVYYQTNKHEFNLDKSPLLKKIEYFLIQRFEFQRNSVTKKIFYRDKSKKDSAFEFCNYNDIWRLLQHHLLDFGPGKVRITITDVSNLLESNFVKQVNPFHEYFHSLPHWDGHDHITKLSSYIKTTDQPFWESQLRKALIRMIACAYGGIENRIIMVLVQPKQSTGKDTWIRFLCPPELREYYKEDPMIINKDSEIALCQNFIWNLTELDQLTKKEVSEIKGVISRSSVKQRRAYGRQEENMDRVVSFWGTTNKEEFLTDTQNTRWLCFQVEDISHNYNDYIKNIREVDITKVWAQAWYLYKSGEAFMLDEKESEKRDIINHGFEIMPNEKQLIIKYLTPCAKDSPSAEFITVVEILEYLINQTDNKLRLSPENVGRSMTQLDFKNDSKKMNGKTVRGYWAMKMPLLKGITQRNGSPVNTSPEIFSQVPGVSTEDLPF